MPTQISRRTFFKKTIAASAVTVELPYYVPSKALGKNGHVPPNDHINMGFIGTGGQGTGNMIGSDYGKIPGARRIFL